MKQTKLERKIHKKKRKVFIKNIIKNVLIQNFGLFEISEKNLSNDYWNQHAIRRCLNMFANLFKNFSSFSRNSSNWTLLLLNKMQLRLAVCKCQYGTSSWILASKCVCYSEHHHIFLDFLLRIYSKFSTKTPNWTETGLFSNLFSKT